MSESIERLPLADRAEAYGQRLERLRRALDDPDEPLDLDFDGALDGDSDGEFGGPADDRGAER